MYLRKSSLKISFTRDWKVDGALVNPKVSQEIHNALDECGMPFSQCPPPPLEFNGNGNADLA